MLSSRSLLAATIACAGLASAASAVTMPLALNGGLGTRSSTSALPVDVAASYDWTLTLTPMTANGVTGMLFGMPTPLPLYGTPSGNLVMSGTYTGSAPGNLVTRTFTFTDVGAVTPTYNFTVSLDLQADQTVKTTVTVAGLGSFMPGGVIPSNPIMVPVTSVNVGGTASVTAVPTPGAAALAGAGILLANRRRRK